MKKFFSLLCATGALFLVSCGGNNAAAPEQDAAADSIAAVAAADSTADALMAALTEELAKEAPDATLVAQLRQQIEQTLTELQGSANLAAVEKYASKVKAFIEEHKEALVNADPSFESVSTLFSSAVAAPAEALEAVTSDANVAKEAAEEKVAEAVEEGKAKAAEAKAQAEKVQADVQKAAADTKKSVEDAKAAAEALKNTFKK